MNKRILVGGVAVLVILGAAVWWFVLRSDAPPPPVLGAPPTTQSGTSTTETTTTTTSAPDSTVSPGATDPAPQPDSLEGTWSVAAADSFVGYRVDEELARIGFNVAVGRTSQIEGSLQLSDSSIVAVDITVDMASLRSDSSFRDGQMRRQALETDQFPTATFVLAEPIELGSLPEPGEAITATAVGDLTIHGVTNRVEIPLDAQLNGGRIEVVATTRILFADYDIDRPSAGSVLSVEEEGDLEMQLFFEAQ